VGDNGVILGYCQGVWDHAIITESLPTTLWDVHALQYDLAVAVGNQGAILMFLYDSVAASWVWTKSPIPVGNQALYSVSMVPDGQGGFSGWAVGTSDASGRGTLVKGTITPIPGSNPQRYNYTWENLTANFPALPQVNSYLSVQMISPTNGWAVGGTSGERGVILRWNGSIWSVFQEVGDQTLTSILIKSSNEGWAVGTGGVIYKYNGSTWSSVDSPTGIRLNAVNFSPDGRGWIVGRSGIILVLDNGIWKEFTDIRTDSFDYFNLDFTSGQGWLVGYNAAKGIGGHILEYYNGLWLPVTPPTDNRLNAVSAVSENEAWAVGMADSLGGTIIRWDGRHWQRWFQSDLPIPAVNLYAIDMVSSTEGWAAGDPPAGGGPTVFLHWDGHRWSPPRYDAPLNVRVNDLAMLDADFGWAVANTGNAVAKWESDPGYWSANHTCHGIYYNLRSVDIHASDYTPFGDAWSVGGAASGVEYFLRFMDGCAGSFAWQATHSPAACPDDKDGPTNTRLFGIKMNLDSSLWGRAVGDFKNRASIYTYNGLDWTTSWCYPKTSPLRPSRLYTTDIVAESGVSWFAGYYTPPGSTTRFAYIRYADSSGNWPAATPYPVNGRNIYHRPILDIDMVSDTMGWAVGDGEDPANRSVIYQYPFPNYTLLAEPPSRAVMPGDSTTYTLSVNPIGGFDADVSLTHGVLPDGITVDIDPATIDPTLTSTVTVSTSPTTDLDVYDLPIFGTATFLSGDHDIVVERTVHLKLTVTDHPVYAVSPESGPSGTLVTISGANFGPDPGPGNRSTLLNHVILAGKQMPDASVLSWSNTSIQVDVPDDPGLFPQGPEIGPVMVTAGGTDSNDDLTFQLENYLLDLQVSPAGGALTVTLTGTSLGNDPGPLFRSTSFEHVSLSAQRIPNADVLSWSNNTITFTVPLGTPPGPVTVTSNGYESNALAFTPGSNTLYIPMLHR
jgi:photosystem II stability/assembly factor-like uncharacterized protein